MNNPSGDEENTYHVQNVSDSSNSNNSDNNIREQLNTYDTYSNFNRYHEANIEVRQFDDMYLEDSNDDTNYSPRGEGYADSNRNNIFDGPRSYRYVRPVNENELEFVIDDFIDRVKEGESFMSPWRQTPSCVFRLLFLRKRKHLRNGFETYFSAFIETIRKDDWVSDWGFYDVQYYIILFNLIDYRRSFYKTDHFNFNHLNTDRGWHEFIDADQISEPGFIHRDGHVVLRAGMYPYGSENYKNSKEGNYNSKMRTGFVGLKNHGATCYMNALLQLLYHINIFRNAVCMMVFNIEKTIGKQTLEFYKKKLIKKKKKKEAVMLRGRALERDRNLERDRTICHLHQLKQNGAATNLIREGITVLGDGNIMEIENEQKVEMNRERFNEMENKNIIDVESEHRMEYKKGNGEVMERENGKENLVEVKNENEEQTVFSLEDQGKRAELMENIFKTDNMLLKLAETLRNPAAMPPSSPSGVAITRRENGEYEDNIKDPFAACESSSDPSIGTSRNGVHIFGNLDESLLLDGNGKERIINRDTEMIDSRGLLNGVSQGRGNFGIHPKDILSDRMRELEIEVDRDVNSFTGPPEMCRDNSNFMNPSLNGRNEQEILLNQMINNNINDIIGRDISQLRSHESDDLENYSWNESFSDSNLSVLSLSSSGSSSYETCSSSSASCYYKKKKNKNKVVKSKEINYRNILLEEEAERKNAPAVSLALQNLFYKLHTMREAVSCKELIRSFGWDASDVFTQQDTHELLKLLLDKVEEQMKGTVVEGYVKKLFEGEVETYIECIDIEYKSLRKETYEDIQLDVQGCNNIYESLDKAIEAEILEGDNIYETDGFGKQRAKKGMRFLSFPNICIFLLKRFTFDLQKMETVKLNNHFEFYKELDLSKYCPDGGEYVLQAVSVHQGSMNSGHYYSFSYKHDEKVWIKCDDEKIFRVSEYSVINDNFGGYDIVLDEDLYDFNIKERLKQRVKHYSAYMLVYVKKSLIPSLIKECNPALVNPQVVRRCKLEEIINRKRMELRQKILQYIKVKVYDKYSYMYKSFRDLPSEGILALFSMKFDRNTSIWEVYRKIIKGIEKIYDRKKKKRITKMCKQTNKKQKTLQMLDHCMNAEITQTKRDIDDSFEVAEKRSKITHVVGNNITEPTDHLILNHNNNHYIMNTEGKERENGTEFLSAQEERNEAVDSAGIDPNLVYFTHQQCSKDRESKGMSHKLHMLNETNKTNDASDIYKNMQQKRKMETWNDANNHRSSGSDSGKGVKTAKTEMGEKEKGTWKNRDTSNIIINEEMQKLNEEEANHGDDEREEQNGEEEEQPETKVITCRVKNFTVAKEDGINEQKQISGIVEEKENNFVMYSNIKEDDNVKLIEQNINNIKLEKSIVEEDSENEEMILPSFDSDSLSSSQSCLTVVGNDINIFTAKKKTKKKKKMRKKGKMTSVYSKRMRNRSNSSSSNVAYDSSDSIESDDSDSSSDDSSPLHLTAFHLQSHHCIPRHRRPFPSTLSDSSSNSVSPCSGGKSSEDDSSKVSELHGGLKENDDRDNSINSNNSNKHNDNNNDVKGEEDSDSTCSDFTRATRSFFLLVSNRDVYRYLSIPLKKYGNYRLWELLDKTNKESNDLFPTLEILYLPYHKKTKVSHKSKKGENRLLFVKYFDIFKQDRISDSSLICLDILNCNEHIKPRHLERRALEKIIKAMEKGYVTKYSYDFLVQYLKNGRAVPPYPLRFKIFVEYSNYRHVLKIDKSLSSNKVIAGDILVFNFFCNDAMEEAKINIYREGKRKEDFELTNEFQINYTARANSNIYLKILYKKMKLLNKLEKFGNCSYLINNRDGTCYRVRVLTDEEENKLREREIKEMKKKQKERRQREKKEKGKNERDIIKKDKMTEEIKGKMKKSQVKVTTREDLLKNLEKINPEIYNMVEKLSGTMLRGKQEHVIDNEEDVIQSAKENAALSNTTNGDVNDNINVGVDKNSAIFKCGTSESSCSEINNESCSDEENQYRILTQDINDYVEEIDTDKHEYIIRKEEEASLITLSDLINFDELNKVFTGDYTISDKDIKAVYIFLQKNKQKYGTGMGQQEYVFSLIEKDSYEIVKLINTYIMQLAENPIEVKEHGIDKKKILCRDHQYPYYSPSSSDIATEKEKNVSLIKKTKRPKKKKVMKQKKYKIGGKKNKKGKENKKERHKKNENLKAANNFCEFMNYPNDPSILSNGKVVLNGGIGDMGEREKEETVVTNKRTQEKEKMESEGENEKNDMEISENQKDNDNNEKKQLDGGFGQMENTSANEKEREKQNENAEERGSDSESSELNSKYLQGYMCAHVSDISDCSSARSSLTFTSETSDYYLENFQEDRLDCEYLFEVYDHKKKQKEMRKFMKQKMKRKKTSRSREGKNGGSGDTGKVFMDANRIISENSEDKGVGAGVGVGVGVGIGVELGVGVGITPSLCEPNKEDETAVLDSVIATVQDATVLENQSYHPVMIATNNEQTQEADTSKSNCTPADVLMNNENVNEKDHKNNAIINLDCGENFQMVNGNIYNQQEQNRNEKVQNIHDLKDNTYVNDIENNFMMAGEKQMNNFFSVGESDDESNEDHKNNIFSKRRGNDEGDASLSNTHPFLENEKKKKKEKIIKKVGGSKCEIEPILPFYLVCDFYDFVEQKMHIYKFRFKVYDPIYQLGKYRNCAGMFLKKKIKKNTLNYIDSFYKFYKREIDKLDIEIDVRGPSKRIFQHVCHKLNIDPARVLIYPFPPLLAPINYTPFHIDSVSCLMDLENEAKGNRSMLEPTCFQYFFNKLTSIDDPFSIMEERTCFIVLLPLHYRYIFKSFMKRCTKHLFYVIQLFNIHAQVVSAFCGHVAYRINKHIHGNHGKSRILNDATNICGNFDMSDEDSDDGRSTHADRPTISEFSTVQDLINKIKLEMNPYLKKRGVDAKQKFRLSYICDTRIRYLKNEEPLIFVDFFKNRSVTSMFMNPLRMEPDYTETEKTQLDQGELRIIQVFHNAPIKAWIGFGFAFEVLVKPTDSMSEIKSRIKKKTLLPRFVFEKLSFFELEDDQRVWKSNDDIINWEKKDIAILIADHNCPSNSRNQKGMRIA